MPFTLTMPKLSPTMEAGTIAKWHVKEGDFVDVDGLLMEVATDKATVEYVAIDPGYLRKIIIQEGQDAVVNQPLAIFTEEADESIEGYEPEGEAAQAAQKPATPEPVKQAPVVAQTAPVEPMPEGRVNASPLARVLAKQRGISLHHVQGTGPNGRIMSRDLEKQRRAPDVAAGSYSEEPLSQIRKVIGQRLQQAKQTIPHFYVTQKIDVTRLLKLRSDLKEGGVKLTINDFVLKAVALSLLEHPKVNSGYDPKKEVILRFHTVDVCVAVDIEGGLITPIVPHADFKPIQELSQEVKALVVKAHEGKLQPHEFQGGSFTISNLGMFGITDFSAVINPPQGAILAVGGVDDEVKFHEGQFHSRKIMSVTLSVDHRVIDGADAAKFLATLKSKLESPALLIL